MGHYPWFFSHNYLSENLPAFDFAYGRHVRYAAIGFASSVVSDTCSNSIRVLKTTKQTSVVRRAGEEEGGGEREQERGQRGSKTDRKK